MCAFFRGTGTDIEGRTLQDIWSWEDILMEVCHDYIQWLLPTDEKSNFNADAPLLDKELQGIFRSDPAMQHNFRQGYYRFLQFLGVSKASVDDGNIEEAVRLTKAANFEKRVAMCWQGPRNHNWKRISRALRSLRLVGLEREREGLEAFLAGLVAEHPGLVDEEAACHWLSGRPRGEKPAPPARTRSLESLSTEASLEGAEAGRWPQSASEQ